MDGYAFAIQPPAVSLPKESERKELEAKGRVPWDTESLFTELGYNSYFFWSVFFL